MAALSLSLYQIEEHLNALDDTAELVSADQEKQFVAEFGAALLSAAEKRDRVAQFLAFLEHQQSFADAEIKRLQALKKHYAAVQGRLETYVIFTIESLGLDEKGKYRRLEGNTTVLSLQPCPPSVSVSDEASIPLEYKRANVQLPAALWDQILDSLDIDLRTAALASAKVDVTVEKSTIKKAIDAGKDVPGTDLLIGKHTLRRR